MENLTSYVMTVLDGGMSWLGASACLGLQLFSSGSSLSLVCWLTQGKSLQPLQILFIEGHSELWWMVIISSPCGEIVGKEITSSNHFHPSASAVLCLPGLLSSSGYHASSVFETCQNILSLKKDTFGMSIIGIYIVLGPRGVWHNSFTLNTAISLQKPTKSHRPSDNNCFTFLNLPVIWGMSELLSWELLLSTIYWGLFFNTRIYYNFF